MNKSIIILLIAVILTGCSSAGNDYVLKIDNEKIGLKEYMIYFYEQKKSFEEKGGEDIWEMSFDGVSAQEVAKQNAVNSIVMVKTAGKQAEELNIFLNEEDNVKIDEETDKLYLEMGNFAADNGITEEDIRQTVRESTLQEKVFNFVTEGYEISEADFEVYFDNYCEENQSELKNVTIRYIYKKCDTAEEKNREEFEKIYEELIMGEDFEKLQQKYSDGNKNAADLRDCELSENIKKIAYSINDGEISDIITETDGFYIVKAEKTETVNMEELREKMRDVYALEKKEEIYTNQNDIWIKDIRTEKNEQVWSEIFLQQAD